MNGRFQCEGCIKFSIRERNVLERNVLVACNGPVMLRCIELTMKSPLTNSTILSMPSALAMSVAFPYLVTIVIQTDNMATRKGGKLFSRTSHTTADIEDTHSGSKTHHVSEVVFMPRSRLLFVFGTSRISTHVERLAPRFKIEVCRRVIVAVMRVPISCILGGV